MLEKYTSKKIGTNKGSEQLHKNLAALFYILYEVGFLH